MRMRTGQEGILRGTQARVWCGYRRNRLQALCWMHACEAWRLTAAVNPCQLYVLDCVLTLLLCCFTSAPVCVCVPRCYECNELGHMARDCPRRGGGGRRRWVGKTLQTSAAHTHRDWCHTSLPC